MLAVIGSWAVGPIGLVEAASPNYDIWHERVIYQIVTDRFYNGNTSNDALIPSGCNGISSDDLNLYMGGDWAGVQQQLLYVRWLTANASLWLSPIDNQISTVINLSCAYHGYWPNRTMPVNYSSCPVVLNSIFGTTAEFTSLLSAIKSSNMLYIQDQVTNHCGYNCDWFTKASAIPGNSDFTTTACGSCGSCQSCINCELAGLPDIYQTTNPSTNAWKYDTACQTAYQSAFSNYANIWAIRFDAVANIGSSFFTSAEGVVNSQSAINPALFTFGEHSFPTTSCFEDYLANSSSPTLGLAGMLNWGVFNTLPSLYTSGGDAASFIGTVSEFYSALSTYPYTIDTALSLVNFMDNHDQNRIASQLLSVYGSATNACLANLYMLFGTFTTIPGIPSIYYGTEIGMVGQSSDNSNRNIVPSWMFNSGFSGFNANSGWYLPTTQAMAVQINATLAKAISIRNSFSTLQKGNYYELWAHCSSSCPFGVTSNMAVWSRSLNNASYASDLPIIMVMNNGAAASGTLMVPVNANATSLTTALISNDQTKLIDGTVLVDLFQQPVQPGVTATTISGGYLRAIMPNGKSLSMLRPRLAVGACSVTFEVSGASVAYGQAAYLTGSIAELQSWGDWNGIRMWYNSATGNWQVTINYLLPGTVLSFKTTLQPWEPATSDTPCDSTSTGSGWFVSWEAGNDHSYTVPTTCSSTTSSLASATVSFSHQGWQSPASSC